MAELWQVFQRTHPCADEVQGVKDSPNPKQDPTNIVSYPILGKEETDCTDKHNGQGICSQLETNDEGSDRRPDIGPHDDPNCLA